MDMERVAPGCLFVVIAGFLVLATFALGCGTTPVQEQASVIDIGALATGTAARLVSVGTTADAQTTCPDGSDPACVDALGPRWAPADAALAAVQIALGTWLALDRIASQSGSDPLEMALPAIVEFVRAYAALREALLPLHIVLPELSPQILELVPATSGGSV